MWYVYSIYIAVWYRYGVQRSHVGLIRCGVVVYGTACGVCGRVAVWCGVAWCVMTASYMLIEVRMMCMRPYRLLAVVRCFLGFLSDVYFPFMCDTSVLHAI